MGVENDFSDFADAMAAAATGYGGLGEPVPYAGGGTGGGLITDAMRDQLAASEAAAQAAAAAQVQQASKLEDAINAALNQMYPKINPKVEEARIKAMAEEFGKPVPKQDDRLGQIDWGLAEKLGLPVPRSLTQAQLDKYGTPHTVLDRGEVDKIVSGKDLKPSPHKGILNVTKKEDKWTDAFHPSLPPIGIPSAIGSMVLQNWDRGRRSNTGTFSNIGDPNVRSDLFSDIPAQMPGYNPNTPDPYVMEDDGGNIAAIRRFLKDPTYGNIPEIDPISALAAYENAIRGIDALVDERGFTDRGYAQAARDRAQGIFDEFQAGQDFDSMLNEKIGRAFADEALFNKDIELRGQGVQAVEQAFPQGFEGDIFNPEAFNKAAENIYGQKLQGAQDIIARAGSRGQLSPRGGRLASESLLSQGPDVQSRLTDILGGVRSEAESGLSGIRGSALEAAQGYKLGDELFDITPFETQATDYMTTTAGELPGRISTAVGTDPLFSAVSALQEGGRQQGQVSGTPSFLDVLAEREGGVGTGRDRRGLGSRGSGVF